MPDASSPTAAVSSIPSTDLSVQGIQYFLANLWQVVSGSGGAADAAGGAGAGVIADMMQAYNSFCAFALGLVVLYIMIIGIANSAHEGTPLGKQWNSLWTPIRVVGGMIFVVPVSALKGFSVLQALILFFVGLSVYGSNLLYEKVLDYFAANFTILPVQAAQIQPDQMNLLLTNLACKASYNSQLTSEEFGTISKQGGADDSGLHVKFVNSLTGNSICGEVILDCYQASGVSDTPVIGSVITLVKSWFGYADAAKYQACKRAAQNFNALIDNLDSAVQSAVSNIDQPIDPSFQESIRNAAANYYNQVTNDLKSVMQESKNQIQNGISSMTTQAKADGWLSAGSWFYTIASLSGKMSMIGDFSPTVKGIQTDNIPLPEIVMPPINRAVEAAMRTSSAVGALNATMVGGEAGKAVQSASGAVMSRPDVGTSDTMHEIFGYTLAPLSDSWKFLAHNINKGDPLTQLASTGHYILGTMTTIWVGSKAIGLVSGAVANKVPGGGRIAKAISELTGTAAMFYYMIMGMAFTTGLLLAYYLPMLPAIFWWLAITGWLITVFLTVLAAPIWAVAHAFPDGQTGPASHRAAQGYQMLVGVILKPILMTLTLFGAYLISVWVVRLVTMLFAPAFDSALSPGNFSLLAMVIGPLLYAIVITILVQKVYEMIFTAPDHVLRFIGFGLMNLGEESGTGRISGAFGKVSDVGARMATSVGGTKTTGEVEVGGGKGRGKGKGNVE